MFRSLLVSLSVLRARVYERRISRRFSGKTHSTAIDTVINYLSLEERIRTVAAVEAGTEAITITYSTL